MSLPRPLRWLALLLALYLAAPFAAVFPQLAAADWSALRHAELWRAAAVSFASASLATVLVGAGGVPLGYVLAARRGAASRALGFLVQLPLALPPLASGVLLLFLLGPYSPLGRWAAALGLPLTDSFAGIVLAEAFVAAPFLVVAARSAFAAADRSLEDVAASLGHGAASRFFRVALPQAGPAVAAGLLLAWLRAMGEFGATVMLAYHPYSLPVFTYVSFGSEGLPAMLPILLPTLAAVLLGVAAIALLQRRPRRTGAAHAAARRIAQVAAASPERARERAEDSHLDVHLRGRRGGFGLDLGWRSEARRIAIVGPSGAGKTLALRLLAGLEPAADARVVYNGQALHALPPERRRVAYVPQHYGLFPHLQVADQLLFAPDADPAAAAYWARRLDLLPLLERRPAQLSSGQQQRVALARAMSRPGEMILLDEPFAALDTPLRGQLRHLLRSVQEELAATTVLVTHDPQDAAQLADEIVVMAEGRVLQHGAAGELFRRPGSVRVAELLGIPNVFEARVEAGGGVRVGGAGGLVLPWAGIVPRPGEPALARVPPEAVAAVAQGPWLGVVEDSWSTPDGARLALRVDGCVLVGAASTGLDLAVGSACAVAIDAARIDVWPAAS
jgi:molybdate transport system permease protein